MVINTNSSAQVGADNLTQSQASLSKSLARLSSGSRIVNPGDDAAGLAVSTRLDAQVQRLSAAKSNVGNAVSFTQTQDGYLQKIGKAFNRMSELAILAQDVTKSPADLQLYDREFQQLSSYISTGNKEFNGVTLFSDTALDVTIDSEGASFQMAGIPLTGASPAGVLYDAALGSKVDSVANAATALANVKAAITQLSDDRATIGSYQARLNLTAEQLSVSKENLTAANSRIKDVDVADESTEYARANILVQSGTAMLAQANAMPQSVLRLLQQ